MIHRTPEPPALAVRGAESFDADATGALARLASDVQAVDRAIGQRFPADGVVARFNDALRAGTTDSTTAWTEFYLALARFVSVASAIVPVPPPSDALAAFVRLQHILDDDFAERLFPAPDRRRLMRRVRRLMEPVAPVLS